MSGFSGAAAGVAAGDAEDAGAGAPDERVEHRADHRLEAAVDDGEFDRILVVVVGGAVGYYFWGRKATAEEYLTAKIERGNIRQSVSATGTLQAVTTVQVGSQVSGIISALYVDFNSTVKKGQVVAQLDPAIFQAQVAQQRANVEQARASLADAEARVIAGGAHPTTYPAETLADRCVPRLVSHQSPFSLCITRNRR